MIGIIPMEESVVPIRSKEQGNEIRFTFILKARNKETRSDGLLACLIMNKIMTHNKSKTKITLTK